MDNMGDLGDPDNMGEPEDLSDEDGDDWADWDKQRPADRDLPGAIRAFVQAAMIDKLTCSFWIDRQNPDNQMLVEYLDLRSDDEFSGALLEAIHEGMRLLAPASATLAFFAIPKDPGQQVVLAARVGSASLLGLARGEGSLGPT